MDESSTSRRSIPGRVLFGAAAWLVILLVSIFHADRYKLIELLLLLAIWVLVPLGLALLPSRPRSKSISLRSRTQIPAALLVTGSFLFDRGVVAALLAGAWLIVCAICFQDGTLRLIESQLKSLPQFCFAAGEAYLLIGGAALILSRLGLQPMSFQEPIVLLTAVHFHFAGFLSAVLAGLTYDRLRTTRWAKPLCASLLGVVLGPGLLGLAFLIGPKLKLFAAMLIVIGQFGLAMAMFRVALTAQSIFSRWMLMTSAVSVVAGMAFAAAWAFGEYPLHPFLDLDRMARVHGVLNAVGFGACGLLGWALAGDAAHPQPEVR
jgi:hypothetical protein